jgi:hypothetical protein
VALRKDFGAVHFDDEVPGVEAAAGAGLELESLEDFVSVLLSDFVSDPLSDFVSLFVSLDEPSLLDPLLFEA